MTGILLLDTGVLGVVANPKASGSSRACKEWLDAVLIQGCSVFVPEIADYEVRRELIRANKVKGIERLDELGEAIGYLPLSTEMMRRAAELWAESRQRGQPTASPSSLDADVILAAQAIIAGEKLGEPVLVATNNVRHLSRFVAAKTWSEIVP